MDPNDPHLEGQPFPEPPKRELSLDEKIAQLQGEKQLALWRALPQLASAEGIVALTNFQDDLFTAIGRGKLPDFLQSLSQNQWVQELKAKIPAHPVAPKPTENPSPALPTPTNPAQPERLPSPSPTVIPVEQPGVGAAGIGANFGSTETPPPYSAQQATPTPTPTMVPAPPVQMPVPVIEASPVPASIPEFASELLKTGSLPQTTPAPTFVPTPPGALSGAQQQNLSQMDVSAISSQTEVPQAFNQAFSGDLGDNKIK